MWSLKVVKGAELAEKLVPEVQLPEPLQRFIIGRDPAAGWPIVDRTLAISARHCEIVTSEHGPLLRDLSTNGTFVNDAVARLAGDHVLRDGDRIEIGPFLIAVSGPPMPPRPVAASGPRTEMPVRSPGVLATAPQRGGDPAAMLAAGGGHEAVRLTEILRVAKPVDDAGVDLTRIRMVTPAAARPPADAPPPAPVPTTVAPAASLPEALARGLGLPAQALAGHDPLVLAEQLAAAVRAAGQGVHALLQQQAADRRALGRPDASLPGAPAAAQALERAASVDAAQAVVLAAPAATLAAALQMARLHDERLAAACRQAARQLSTPFDPPAGA